MSVDSFVEQYVKVGIEERFPPLGKMRKEILLMREQLVQATVQLVLLDKADVFTEQIGHGAVMIPFSMQAPFAAWRYEVEYGP